MKIIPVLLFLLFSFSVFAQKPQADTIPEAVKKAFQKEYPDGKIKEWKFREGNYVAISKIDGQAAEAYFNSQGSWVETVFAISDKEMPGRISNYLNTNYPACEVVLSQYKENKSNGAFYFLQVKKNKSSQQVDAEMFFDVSGNFLTKTEFYPLTDAISSSTKQEIERKAKEEKERLEYETHRAALLKMDRTVAEADLPNKIRDNFRKKFPKAVDVKWDTLDNIYTAVFTENETPVKADFSPAGDWIATNETLLTGPNFRPIELYLEQNYASYVLKLTQKITSRTKNNFYYLEVHPKGKKGSTPPVTKLYFDKAGRFEKAEEPPAVPIVSSADTSDNQYISSDEPDAFEAKLDKEGQPKRKKSKDEDLTAVKVSAKELPSKVNLYIKENYPEYKVKWAYFSDYDEVGNAYKVTVSREGLNQPPFDLYFSDMGKLLWEDNPPPKKTTETASKKQTETVTEAVKEESEPEVQEEDAAESPEEIDAVDVPAVVKKNFSRRFPKAVDPLWSATEGKYLVEFYLNEIKNILEFSPDGIIQLTRTETAPTALFGPVQRYIDDKYKGYKVRYAEKIVKKDRNNYFYVEIYSKKKNANPPELHLFFDKAGRLMENPPE